MQRLKVPRETSPSLKHRINPFTSQHLAFKPVRQGTNWLKEPSEQRLSICNLNGPRLAHLSCRENSATELRPLTQAEVGKTRRRLNSSKADNGGSKKTKKTRLKSHLSLNAYLLKSEKSQIRKPISRNANQPKICPQNPIANHMDGSGKKLKSRSSRRAGPFVDQ